METDDFTGNRSGGLANEQWHGELRDEPHSFPVRSSVPRFTGKVWSIRSDEVEFTDQIAVRDIQVHPGAVAIVALNHHGEIYLIRQYRHPVASYLFETPAGLLDKPDEDPLAAAKRELMEEAGLIAADWKVLVDLANSPGGSSEILRFYLAREISSAPGGRLVTGEAEEAELPGAWVPLSRAVELVLAGKFLSPNAVVGILATKAAHELHWQTVRAGDSAWESRENLISHNLISGLADDID